MSLIMEIKNNNKIILIKRYTELKINIMDIYDFIDDLIELINEINETEEESVAFEILCENNEEDQKILIFKKTKEDQLEIYLEGNLIFETTIDELIRSTINLIEQIIDDLEEKVIEEIEMRRKKINIGKYYSILYGKICEFLEDNEYLEEDHLGNE